VNWVDAIIIVIALISAYIGYKNGLIRAFFSIVGLIVGVVVAGQWSDSLADKFSPGGALWASVLSFALIVIVILIIANIAGLIVKRFLKFMLMGWVDGLGGMLLGLFVGALLVAAVLTAVVNWEWLQHAGTLSSVQKTIDDSPLANLLMEKFALLRGLLPADYDEALHRVLG
jgi:membrane protein required for colicin V production